MDSVTQIMLGAAVGEAILGRRIGNKAPLWGGLCGIAPDLDVLVPWVDAVASFTYHRSVTHSLFVLTLAALPVSWLAFRMHIRDKVSWGRWLLLVWLGLITHPLLDSLTIYGTQLLWPLPLAPVTVSSLFIVDPLYSLPLLGGLCGAIAWRRKGQSGWSFNAAGLVLSTAYVLWSLGAKYHVESVARDSLARLGMTGVRIMSGPAPLNTLLWRILVVTGGGEDYHEGFYSLLDDTAEVVLACHQSRPELFASLHDEAAIRRLQWFTKGFYKVTLEEDELVFSDLRMGIEPSYVFRFVVGRQDDQDARRILPVSPPRRLVRRNYDPDTFVWVWKRIFNVAAPPSDARQSGSCLTGRDGIGPGQGCLSPCVSGK